MTLIDAFFQGGWPMYPILVCGVILTVFSVRLANRPSQELSVLVRHLRTLTLSLGFLGSVLGLIHCLGGLREVPPEMRHLVIAIGISELINCTSQALIWLIISTTIAAAGAFRATLVKRP